MIDREPTSANTERLWIPKDGLRALVSALHSEGYTVIGPTVDQESAAIVYRAIETVDELPKGWRDTQAAGSYRLKASQTNAYFEFNVGAHSWKQFLFPARLTVSSATRRSDGWEFGLPEDSTPKLAFLGVRACELAAIAVQDRVFLDGPYVDRDYQLRRQSTLIVAVNCTVAAQTCFCTSMDTGPRCQAGFDLALTETEDGFELEVGSDRGIEIVERLHFEAANESQQQDAATARQRAVDQISKMMDTADLHDLLMQNLDHPHWDDVADRCLSCTNCTMVCPTCFCSSVSDVTDLTGDHVDRVRQWDSCFNLNFGYTAGGTVRRDIRSRYRQWLTHKLATWQEQFDSSGCVGCGRCITWCPVGIDITEEVAAIRDRPSTNRSLPVLEEEPAVCVVPKTVPARLPDS